MGINPREWQASTSRASHSEIERQAELPTFDAWRGGEGRGYHGDDDGYNYDSSDSDGDIEKKEWSFQALLSALNERASRMQEVEEETGQWKDSSIHQGETSRAGLPSGEGGNDGGNGDGHHNGLDGYSSSSDEQHDSSDSDRDIEKKEWSFQALLGVLNERASRMQEVDKALEETGQWEDSSIHQGETSRAGLLSGEGGNGEGYDGGRGDGNGGGDGGNYVAYDDNSDEDDKNGGSNATHLSEFEREIERLCKAQELKDWMEEQGEWEVFENTLAKDLPEELATAKNLGVKPMHVNDLYFEKVANEDIIKWVVTESGELLVAPHTVRETEIAHAILTNGGPVVAAGEANIAVYGDERVGIEITNYSGHYLPDSRSLEIGKQAFKAFGITF